MVIRTPRSRSLLLLPLALLGAWAHAQWGGDLQARILYAFHAEDINQLSTVIQTLRTQQEAGNADDALRYHLAHAEYRLGLLSAGLHSRDRAASDAFAACVAQLKPLVERTPDAAEVLILQSACYANLARFKTLERALLQSRAGERQSAALRLEPRNPRVAYITAVEWLARSKPGTAEHQKAVAELQTAVQLFEESSATRDDVPGWGHAEAYLEYGRRLQARGDLLEARNWIEKALIMAPDYKAAQSQLASVVRR